MFIDLLNTDCPQDLSLFCLGDWIVSIPSRISSSPVVSIAAEFFVHSYNFHRDQSYSNRTKALQTKGKALKELQLSLSESQPHPTYNLIVATKLHYSAEVLIGVDQMGYAVHALGLLNLLKSGIVSGVDQEHFWNVVESTYVDDITMAVTAGRPSVYDHDFYLSATHPDALSVRSLTPTQRVKTIMMHCLIQCPRLIVAIRHASRNPSDLVAIATAVTLADNLWKLSQQQLFADFVDDCLFESDDHIDDTVADIIPSGIGFSSVQNMVTCTKYWMLQNLLCGCLDTLHRKFAHGFLCSNLPSPKNVHEMDTQAAKQLGRAVLGLGDKVSPLTLLRAHGPLSFSIGAWHRQVRYLRSSGQTQSLEDHTRILAATRMQKWILNKCNSVLERLHVSQAAEIAWIEALDSMAGEELADWIPNKVSIDSEDGEIVMKLEYNDRRPNDVGSAQSGGEVTRTVTIRDPANFGPQHLRDWVRGNGGLPANENIMISYL
ncbi:hypothetical protein E8E13_011069 [Curvularia kusanoi]|uniref:Uncharacterized protein n=1 Tax=Curvularia kusanoi TaxID=90978 RepID=A0A9P4TI07_CURKU|nr:hypothetical protein E8E13_011069 [Curvularia kusanoi]